MRCKFCPSTEELKWPENYKKGDKPINAQTNQSHICIETPKNKGWRKTKCPDCGIEINHNRNIHQPNGLCEDCKNKEDHELMFK